MKANCECCGAQLESETALCEVCRLFIPDGFVTPERASEMKHFDLALCITEAMSRWVRSDEELFDLGLVDVVRKLLVDRLG